MNAKRLAVAAAFLIAGIGTLLWQINTLHTEGYYYKWGILSAFLIVIGIASFFIDFSDLSVEDENGKRQSLSFSEMSTGWKAALVLGGITGLGQLIYFEMGAPVFW